LPIETTLTLLAAGGAATAFCLWQVRRKRLDGQPSLIDWHYALFPALVLTLLLAVHAVNLLLGR